MSENNPLSSPRLWDHVATAYDEHMAPHLARYGEDALRLAGVAAGQRVLDVACGPGALALTAARLGACACALDFSPAMVERLRQAAGRAGVTSIEGRVGDAMALPYPDGSFDAAFCMFGFMFLPDRERGFRELWRVLAPGGRAVVASWVPTERVPQVAAIYRSFARLLPNLPFGTAHPPLGTASELCAEMASAGFRQVVVQEITHTLQVSSVDELWDRLVRSTPPFYAAREAAGEIRWTEIARQLRGALRAECGAGPQSVPMPALLAIGCR
jgi:ubiquinone/menaquinone biosynthesis C-methylase UbiE